MGVYVKQANPQLTTATIAQAVTQTLLAHGSGSVLAIDPDCHIRWVGRAAAGADPAGMLGTSCLDQLPTDCHTTCVAVVERVLRTGQPAAFEVDAAAPGGGPSWQMVRVLPLPPGTGLAGALLVAEDITDRKQLEQTLQHMRDMLVLVVDGMPGLACLIDGADLRVRFVNRAYRNLAPGKEMVGRSLQQIWPETGQDVASICHAVLATGTPCHRVDDQYPISRAPGGPTEHRSFTWTLERIRLPGEAHWSLLNTGTETTSRLQEERRLQQALEALGATEERLRLALEASAEGLWDWNLVTDACFYSPAYFEMLGHPPEAMASQVSSVQSLLHPDDHGVIEEGVRLLHDPGHFTLRFRLRAANGEYRWIESHGKAVQRGADGHLVRAVGTHVDITERLQLERALQQSEARLRAIIDGTSDAVFVKDLQGRYVLVNRAALPGGWRRDQVIGSDDTHLLPPEMAASVMALDRHVMQTGQLVTVQETLDHTGGDARTFLTTKGPLCDDTGQVMGMFGIARDITDVLRHEEAQRAALAESRDMLDLALGAAELATFDIDMRTGRARYDERNFAMLGHGPGGLAPTQDAWLALIHPEDLAAVREAMRAHEAGETRMYEFEHRLRHKDGHWIWVLARGKVLRDADGRPLRAVGTHQDITDRKRVATEGAMLLKRIETLIGELGARPRRDSPAQPDAPALPPGVPLSARSREVLALLAAGLTAAEVAQRLGITRETANTHRRNLMRKLGVRNKAELIRYALTHAGPAVSTSRQ